MRIISGLLFTFFILFFITRGVYASITACPPSGGEFSRLCGLGIGSVGTAVSAIIEILLILAIILAIIFLIWGGVKWIFAGGDKAAIEGARSTIIAAIVGLVMAFTAFLLYNLILYLFGIPTGGSFTLPRLIPV